MTIRDTLLIAHGSLHPALRWELAARGLTLRESRRWQDADRSEPERILGAYTWFYQAIRNPLSVLRMRHWLAEHNIPLFCWNQDAPHYLNYTKPTRRWRLALADQAKFFDIYATHTLIDSQRQFADTVLYLPNAADIATYNLRGDSSTVFARMRDPKNYRWDVTFFGGMNGKRYKEDRAREVFFDKLAKRLDARGITHCFRETNGMTPDEQIAFIQASRINLNFGARCEYNAPVASGLPERCYGIPASGGFLLCDKRTHAKDDFSLGENWAEFDGTVDDGVAQIEHWLAHFEAARHLAECCYQHVMTHHTYTNRAEKLHRALLGWHAGKRGLIL